MGSFNVTCSVTNLPIQWNEKVKVGFLVESPNYDMIRTCSKYRFMFPFLLDGVYDDYGECKVNVSDETRQMIDEFIKKNAIIAENDETIPNTSTKLNRDTLSLETIYHFLHEGVLYFKQGDNYIARESVEFQDVYSQPIKYDRPVQVFPFTIKKDIYDSILSGSYDPECPVFENGEMRYENLTFEDFKTNVFGDPSKATLLSFFTYLMEKMKNRDEELVEESIFNDDVENKDALISELTEILEGIPRTTFLVVSMSIEHGGGEKSLRKAIQRVVETADEEDAKDERKILDVVDFFDRNKDSIDTSGSHRRVVYEYINKVSMHDSGARTTEYMHFYQDFFMNSDIDIDEFKNFYSFMLWYDNYIHGTVTPSRYSGQDYNTRAYKLFFNSCLDSIKRYEEYIGEDEDYDEEE